MERFQLKPTIFFGPDALAALEGLAGRRVMVITDSFLAQSGLLERVRARLRDCTVEVFDQVVPDPPLELVAQGARALAEFRPQAVVAFGGGSPMDCAKAMLEFGKKLGAGADIRFVAVPTTAGTGSEVTSFAVLTDREKGVKYPLVEDSLLPDIAILDAELTTSVPPTVTADTGIDVFTHAVEAFVSTEATDFSDAAAEKAIKLVKRHLLPAYQNPEDRKARQGMHNASCLAGIAFSNSGLGLNHGMAHALGARFHIPHGRANGILLPYVMSFNAGCAEQLTSTAKRYARISRLLELESSSVRQSALNLIRTARRYIEKLNMPSTLQAAGVNAAEFEEAVHDMAEAALADRCTATNPRSCTAEEIEQIFRKAYSGKLP